MKPKTKFNIIATMILAAVLVSWFFVQRVVIGPVQDFVLTSLLNLLGHAVVMWSVLRIVAKGFRE